MVASQQAAFIRQILANPRDDFVKLVYSDWLEENGYGSWAHYIRMSIEGKQDMGVVDNAEHVDEVRRDLRQTVCNMFNLKPTECMFDGGLVNSVSFWSGVYAGSTRRMLGTELSYNKIIHLSNWMPVRKFTDYNVIWHRLSFVRNSNDDSRPNIPRGDVILVTYAKVDLQDAVWGEFYSGIPFLRDHVLTHQQVTSIEQAVFKFVHSVNEVGYGKETSDKPSDDGPPDDCRSLQVSGRVTRPA
jgi:uncharacterized protein (TIGR02996 family)